MVATLMGGGPCVAYMKYVYDACEQFGPKETKINFTLKQKLS